MLMRKPLMQPICFGGHKSYSWSARKIACERILPLLRFKRLERVTRKELGGCRLIFPFKNLKQDLGRNFRDSNFSIDWWMPCPYAHIWNWRRFMNCRSPANDELTDCFSSFNCWRN